MKIANTPESVIPDVCNRESSLVFRGVDRVQGKDRRLWILYLTGSPIKNVGDKRREL